MYGTRVCLQHATDMWLKVIGPVRIMEYSAATETGRRYRDQAPEEVSEDGSDREELPWERWWAAPASFGSRACNGTSA